VRATGCKVHDLATSPAAKLVVVCDHARLDIERVTAGGAGVGKMSCGRRIVARGGQRGLAVAEEVPQMDRRQLGPQLEEHLHQACGDAP